MMHACVTFYMDKLYGVFYISPETFNVGLVGIVTHMDSLDWFAATVYIFEPLNSFI